MRYRVAYIEQFEGAVTVEADSPTEAAAKAETADLEADHERERFAFSVDCVMELDDDE